MPVTVIWDNAEQTVIRGVFEGLWTLEDFYRVNSEFNALMDSVSHRVNVIFDMHQSKAVPKGFMGALRSQSNRPMHPNMGVIVSIGNNTFLRAFSNLFMNLYPTKARGFYMAGSDEEAYAIFARTEQEELA